MTTPMDQHFNLQPISNNNAGGNSPDIPQRKKLQLKPRSVALPSPQSPRQQHRAGRHRSLSCKGNPFGDAIPREEILEKRGIDFHIIDSKFEKKAATKTYTPSQEAQLDILRTELDHITEQLRDANEKELPEEKFRLAEEKKRQELNDLMERFDKMNTSITSIGTSGTGTSEEGRDADNNNEDMLYPKYFSRNNHRHAYSENNVTTTTGSSSSSNVRRYNNNRNNSSNNRSNNYNYHHQEQDMSTNESTSNNNSKGDPAFASFFSNRRRNRRSSEQRT